MKNRRAFTLIELLVVVSIIALLLSILMPALGRAREQAKNTICKSNLKNMGIGMDMYLTDHEYRFADCSETNRFLWYEDDGTTFRRTDDNDAYWGVAYIGVIKETEIFGCPSFQNVTDIIYPQDPDAIKEASYGLNSNINDMKISAFKRPSELIVTHDHVEPKIEQGSQDMLYNSGPGTMNLTDYRAGGNREDYYRGIFRHMMSSSSEFETGGSLNVLWADWHVTSINETTGDNIQERWYTGGI